MRQTLHTHTDEDGDTFTLEVSDTLPGPPRLILSTQGAEQDESQEVWLPVEDATGLIAALADGVKRVIRDH